MNNEIRSASPRAILTGIDDKSTMPMVYEQLNDAQHCPLFMIMTKRGPTDITFVDSARFAALFSLDSLNPTSAYHTHQTEAVSTAFRNANASVAIKRIVGPNASTAKLDILVVPFDVAGKPPSVKVGTQDEFASYPEALAGTPLISFETAYVGDDGNNFSVCIVPASDGIQRLKGAEYNGFIYELYIEEINPVTKLKTPVYTQYRDLSVLFTLNADDQLGNKNPYFLGNVIESMYTNEDVGNAIGVARVDVNLETLQKLHAMVKVNESKPWSYDILGRAGMLMAKGMGRYLTGGSDGFTQSAAGYVSSKIHLLDQYDTAIRHYFENMDRGHELGDIAKNPISVIYDTGFSTKTKLSFRNVLAIREDVAVGLSVYTVADHYKDIDEDDAFQYSGDLPQADAIAAAVQLRASYSLLPESDVYGTPAMRAFIVMQSGIYAASGYNRRQSIILDIIQKLCRYIGTGDKIWKTVYAFDQSPQNQLEGWSNVNYTYRSQPINDVCWDAGIIWVENKNTSTLFYPSFQTIYPDDTSIYNNILTMFACCYLNKIARLTWAMTTGDNQKGEAEIIEAINDIIIRETYGKFDNRYQITVDTEFTRADRARGYSWSTFIHLYASTAKTVATYKITANRMS